MFSHLLCYLLPHRYYKIKDLGWGARQVGCRRCGKKWAMHDPSQSFLPWDADLEALYSITPTRIPPTWP